MMNSFRPVASERTWEGRGTLAPVGGPIVERCNCRACGTTRHMINGLQSRLYGDSSHKVGTPLVVLLGVVGSLLCFSLSTHVIRPPLT